MLRIHSAVLLLIVALALSSGCSQAPAPPDAKPAPVETEPAQKVDAAHEEHAHDDEAHEDHEEHAHDEEHDHHHEPLRGGTLVELGDHVANLEVLLNAEAGALTFYAMDAHVENPVRLTATEIIASIDLKDGTAPFEVTLAAKANALTGETVGDTSEFTVTDERLKGLVSFNVLVPTIDLRGVTFDNVAFPFPEGVQ